MVQQKIGSKRHNIVSIVVSEMNYTWPFIAWSVCCPEAQADSPIKRSARTNATEPFVLPYLVLARVCEHAPGIMHVFNL